MRDLANAIHMRANYQKFFPHWSRARYARMWNSVNPYEAIMCRYLDPQGD